MTTLSSFLDGYITCALWTLLDENGEPCDQLTEDDINQETYEQLVNDATDFWSAHSFSTDELASRAGHDFWLTRNRHGAGFWDGDWEDGEELTKDAHAYGPHELWLGDDERVYG